VIPRILRTVAAGAIGLGLLLAPVGLGMSSWPAPGVSLPTIVLGPASVRAAVPDLTLVTEARYVVQPERARVHIVVDIVATNHRRDTTTRRFYYENANLAVLPGTTRFTIASDDASPAVRVRSKTTAYTVLAITFGKRLYSGQSLALRLQFDLPDPGGAPTRTVRIGPSLVTFPAWAFASDSTPGSSVTVVFPSGYSIRVEPDDLPPPVTAATGAVVFRTGALSKPLEFFAYFTADRPAALVESTVEATVEGSPVTLTLRRWEEDLAWQDRTEELFRSGLPVLGDSIGLPFPLDEPLVVEESASRTTGGYAGLFDPKTRTIQVAYDAGSFVGLHEAAHAWFNGRLLADRWSNEAFASYYATAAAEALGLSVAAPALGEEAEAARIPLNAWGAVGSESSEVEDYGYAASLELASEIGERAGPGVLRAVWTAAASGEAAYQPVDPSRPRERSGSGPPDWRGLLDLLEERTGVTFADLWSTWVVRPGEAGLLDERRSTRATYDAVTRAAGDWELSPLIRSAMSAWQFDQASELLDQASTVLDELPALEADARAAGVEPPGTVREAFEGAAGPGAALTELRAERAAIREIAGAEAIGAQPPGVLARVGLFGETPGVELAGARAAFESGDLTAAAGRAQVARTTWSEAPEIGRKRLIVGLLGVGVVGGTTAFVLVTILRRRRHEAVSAGAYGTLEDESPQAVETGDTPT